MIYDYLGEQIVAICDDDMFLFTTQTRWAIHVYHYKALKYKTLKNKHWSDVDTNDNKQALHQFVKLYNEMTIL